MFTAAARESIQTDLIAMAETDPAIIGAALVGSSATGLQDDLSDIDIALQIAADADLEVVIAGWTREICNRIEIAHTLDVFGADGVLYRVFLTRDSMQIDISFWPADTFRPTGERSRLLFGQANQATASSPADPERLVGMAWLYALHVRSAIARNEPWHAQSLLDDLRDFVLTLACLRHGAIAHQLRGVDSLPAELLARFSAARSATLEKQELQRSLKMHMLLLNEEVSAIDEELSDRLIHPISLIAEY